MARKIKFVVIAMKWRNQLLGNTYFACQITRTSDGKKLYCPRELGYWDQYKQTALEAMAKARWIHGYDKDVPRRYEREHNHPILWSVSHGLKREVDAIGTDPEGV